MELTREQAKAHLDSGGAQCPYCGSEDITGDGVEVEGSIASQYVRCLKCYESWTDNFRLVSIYADGKSFDLSGDGKVTYHDAGQYEIQGKGDENARA